MTEEGQQEEVAVWIVAVRTGFLSWLCTCLQVVERFNNVDNVPIRDPDT